ncbi:MAG: DUF805 domain-containing protein [Elusimicrobiaceae bacterium]|nr:DUF805 domain-containing protein [Elusimicrobiaceae bacterium]
MFGFIDLFTHHYFDYKGKLGRGAYWILALLLWLVGLILGIFAAGWINWLYTLIIICPFICMSARRLRDAGFTPWLALLGLALFSNIFGAFWGQIAIIVLFILCLFPSK